MTKKDEENQKITDKLDEVLQTSIALSKKVENLTKAFNREKEESKIFGWKLFLFGTALGAIIGGMIGLLDSFLMKILEASPSPVPTYLWWLFLIAVAIILLYFFRMLARMSNKVPKDLT